MLSRFKVRFMRPFSTTYGIMDGTVALRAFTPDHAKDLLLRQIPGVTIISITEDR